MRIFLAGGTGILGTRLVPKLTAAGHRVTATTRRAERADLLTRLGATPAIVDVYDADLLSSVVAAAAPDVILHELTDLSEYDTDANARLRREGTANLIAAAQAAGTGRIVVESIAWIFPDADAPATEDDPIVSGTAVDAMEGLARRLPHATILRYGMLYGPGTWYGPRRPHRQAGRRRPASGHPGRHLLRPRRRRRRRHCPGPRLARRHLPCRRRRARARHVVAARLRPRTRRPAAPDGTASRRRTRGASHIQRQGPRPGLDAGVPELA
jgi:nucleoside-diphosphate-sugar epimerase